MKQSVVTRNTKEKSSKNCEKSNPTQFLPHVGLKFFLRLVINPSIDEDEIRHKAWNVAL